jgi:type IV secretory pathway VirJ component
MQSVRRTVRGKVRVTQCRGLCARKKSRNTATSTEPDGRTIQNTPASRRVCVNDEAPVTPAVPGQSVSGRAGMEAREPRAQTAHGQRRLQERGTQSTGRMTRTWQGRNTRGRNARDGVEKWLIEYVRTPGLFCQGRTCGEKKKKKKRRREPANTGA